MQSESLYHRLWERIFPGQESMLCVGGHWSEDEANLKNLTPRYSVHMDMQLISALPLMFRYEAVMGYLGIQD